MPTPQVDFVWLHAGRWATRHLESVAASARVSRDQAAAREARETQQLLVLVARPTAAAGRLPRASLARAVRAPPIAEPRRAEAGCSSGGPCSMSCSRRSRLPSAQGTRRAFAGARCRSLVVGPAAAAAAVAPQPLCQSQPSACCGHCTAAGCGEVVQRCVDVAPSRARAKTTSCTRNRLHRLRRRSTRSVAMLVVAALRRRGAAGLGLNDLDRVSVRPRAVGASQL